MSLLLTAKRIVETCVVPSHPKFESKKHDVFTSLIHLNIDCNKGIDPGKKKEVYKQNDD